MSGVPVEPVEDDTVAALAERVAVLEAMIGDASTDPPGQSLAFRVNRLEQRDGWVPPATPVEVQAALEEARQEAVNSAHADEVVVDRADT